MQAIIARKNGNRVVANATATQQTKQTETFDDTELRLAWVELCDDIGSQDIANAGRMKSLDVHISDFPKVEVVIANQLLENYIMGKKQWIEQFLSQRLKNDDVKLELRLAESNELSGRGMTRAEIFAELVKESKAMALLQEKFQLELR